MNEVTLQDSADALACPDLNGLDLYQELRHFFYGGFLHEELRHVLYGGFLYHRGCCLLSRGVGDATASDPLGAGLAPRSGGRPWLSKHSHQSIG